MTMRLGEANGSESRKAKLSLDFVIVGASVAGLSCAYALRQAGHSVVVLEASKELGWVQFDLDCRCCRGSAHRSGQSPGGVRIPPNMSRIMASWGLGSEMEKLAGGRCPKIVFHSGWFLETSAFRTYTHAKVIEASQGDQFGELIFHKELMRQLEGETYLMHVRRQRLRQAVSCSSLH